ncbi:hypothetical protein [Companilactobacillus futsaii]|uniref:BIG2 domain-containing protein n=2 Tax=Companilactobacillus futsaii TaxID=938155 RepID=A0A5B7T139_9LACO|nr:hypothetical protein [Companilactobacillus futsaii]KRK93521.1 hypothetical protein FC88_GL000229 [Companilactobacillus futsaii JCM 17355]QCX24229.1 hypothetical protein FG051_03505 [Companilactobacillus futsaii]
MKTISLLLKFILPLILALCLFFITHPESILADDAIASVQYHTPTPDPTGGFGFWATGGFDRQPKTSYYTTVGAPIEITTHTVRSTLSFGLNPFETVYHNWFISNDGGKFSQIPNETKNSLVYTPQQTGTYYIQLYTYYAGIFTKDKFYSDVITVHVLKKSIDAVFLNITIDKNYLYNVKDSSNNAIVPKDAYATASPDPDDATGDISWSSDNPSLATIDENGHIVANSDNKSGIVKITGSIKNSDGSIVTSKPQNIKIGGGLENQTVHANQPATFHLQTDEDDKRDDTKAKITWYKRSTNGQVKQLETQADPTTYVTSPTTKAENGDEFYAQITVKRNTVRTNSAVLNVLPPTDPNINIKSSIEDTTFHPAENTDSVINKVSSNDKLVINSKVYNSGYKNFPNSSLSIPLFPLDDNRNFNIDGITVNKQPLTTDDYQIVNNNFNNQKELIIDLKDLKVSDTQNVKIDLTTPTINTEQTIDSTPYFSGSTDDGNDFQSEGNKLQINLTPNQITLNPHSIQFDPITQFQKGTTKYRTAATNAPYAVVSVDGSQRKTGNKYLFVKQAYPLEDKKGDILGANLFYKINNSIQSIKNKVLVEEADGDIPLTSVIWNKKDGLLLKVNSNQIEPGQYSTKLNWTVQNSI